MSDSLSFEVEVEELIDIVNDDFSVDNVTELLSEMCLIDKDDGCSIKNFEKYVFLESFNDEIYSHEERNLISSVDEIFLFPSFYKRIKKGRLSCNVIAVDLFDAWDPIRASIICMKILNKSTEGFNIVLMRLNDGIHIGCRLYNKEDWKDCIVSKNSALDEMVGEIASLPSNDDFVQFYSGVVDVITPRDETRETYEEKIRLRRGADVEYLESIGDVEKKLNVTAQEEKNAYIDSFNEGVAKKSYIAEYLWTLEDLSYIKSIQVNTTEMLFEADEIEQIIAKSSREESEPSGSSDNNLNEEEQDNFSKYKDNPEELIKLLKKQQGIK